MTPFYFGSPNQQLFGLFEPALGGSPAEKAALLCNPFGQEAVRTHRMYRVLADRLVRAGISVMRFDYHGTGDSAGDDIDGDLAGWTRDLAAAHGELVRRSRSSGIVWIGARLGATLAIGASNFVLRPPDHMILWEPIVDGAGYLRVMADRHIQQLKRGCNAPDQVLSEMLASILPGLDREGMGFELSDLLRTQLGQLSPMTIPTPRALRCTVIEQGTRSPTADMFPRWRQTGLVVDEVAYAHDFDWLAAEALNTALVPREAVQLLTRLAVNGSD
jgi:hypothetical protein